MASQIGGAIAPLLVVPIQIRYGWRAAFFVFGAIGVTSGRSAWYAWFRDSPAEKPGVSAAELHETAGQPRTPSHGFPWSLALRSETVVAMMCVALLLRLRLHVLPDVVPHVPGQGPRLHRGRPDVVGLALRARGVRELGRRRRATCW